MGHTTLVIHPSDDTTRFLEFAYQGIDATVVTGQETRHRLRSLIDKFDQIIMLGHGSAHGLFSVGAFPSQFVIDATFVDQLRERDNNVFIWCYAAEFVRHNQLLGFATGMFISELREAEWFKLSATAYEIQESNHRFSSVVGEFASQHSRVLYTAVEREYGKLANFNPVAKFNHPRIRLSERTCYGHEIVGPPDETKDMYRGAGSRCEKVTSSVAS